MNQKKYIPKEMFNVGRHHFRQVCYKLPYLIFDFYHGVLWSSDQIAKTPYQKGVQLQYDLYMESIK